MGMEVFITSLTFLISYLTEILPNDPVLCDGQHFDGVVSSLEGPDLGQDHEGSLPPPDQLHLVLQEGIQLRPTIWSGGMLRLGGLNNLTALLSLSRI